VGKDSESARGPIRVAIVGATGYTGAELARIALQHRGLEVVALIGHGKAGLPAARVLPALAGIVRGDIERYDAASIASRAEAAFCALPHGASAPIVAELRARGLVVLDLSADFRLADLAAHTQWYGDHHAPELAKSAVYGLPELHREALRSADLIAVPGCFPTAATLPLAPLLARGLLEDGAIVIDAKSGVSGAGRSPSERTHFAETAEGIRAYKIAGAHRHTPEIEQELSRAAGRAIRVTFTPHLVPMTRGILATAYARPKSGVDVARCIEAARALYAGSPSVYVHDDPDACPDTLWVRGSNRAHVSYALDARTGVLIAQGAIDNLVKGASGQAIQCLNVRFGLPEGEGLAMAASWP
jgi:N-acetyl-gamma-glutamyl-phosphate reductase